MNQKTRAKLLKVGAANVANILLKRGFKNVFLLGLQPISTEQEQMVGPAYTLRFIPAREDIDNMSNYGKESNLHRRAIEECPSGAVLVIDAMNQSKSSSMGDMMAARLRYRGIAGVVTDGGYRDTLDIIKTELPCYQKLNAPPATPIAMHPIELNGPIACAGVAIYPGDIIVGDKDGVVAIPAHLVEEVAQEALEAMEYEEFALGKIKEGRSIFGLFPATEQSRIEYETWVSEGET